MEGETEMSNFIGELREMLREADNMPVVMDEMLVLRCQVQALDWAVKMRSFFQNSSTIRFADLQKYYREILKIRDSLPDAIAEEYPAAKRALPEEIKCRDMITVAGI